MDIPAAFVRSGAYRDLDTPVVVTSGEFLTPFFVNAERLCGDPDIDSFLATHGGSDRDVIDHACSLAQRPGDFHDVVDELTRHASRVLAQAASPLVSGGQRRDWLFSGPVARRLDLPHVSLYKQAPGQGAGADRLVIRSPRGEEMTSAVAEGGTAVHVVDMITAASSCLGHDPVARREVGWIPMMRNRGIRIEELIAVVSRRQGGEERMLGAGVRVSSLIAVDEAFLGAHARRPAEAIAYARDPKEWTRRYLREHGVELLEQYLVEDAKKLPRLAKLARAYAPFLRAEGLWHSLDMAARRRLGRGLDEMLGAEP